MVNSGNLLLSMIGLKESIASIEKTIHPFALCGTGYLIQNKRYGYFLKATMLLSEGAWEFDRPFLVEVSDSKFLLIKAESYYFIALLQPEQAFIDKSKRIPNFQTWKVLGIEKSALQDRASLTLQQPAGLNSQKFQVIPTGQGYCYLQAKHSGKLLTAERENATAPIKIVQTKFLGNDQQKFRLV